MPPDLLFWSLALAATFLVGASKGGLPLVGMLAVPVMALAMPVTRAAGLSGATPRRARGGRPCGSASLPGGARRGWAVTAARAAAATS
mgnify:CR=1 FL=1